MPSSVKKNPDHTYQLLSYPIDKSQTKSFLYLGSLLENTQVTGKVKFDGDRCTTSLNLKMLNQEGNIIGSIKNEFFSDSSKFTLSITGKNQTYLLLNLLKYDRDELINECTRELNSLVVSSHK